MSIKNSVNRIRCALCQFVKEDKSMSTNTWKAYECGNFESEYYRCLLNVSRSGNMLSAVTWSGCRYGERRCSK